MLNAKASSKYTLQSIASRSFSVGWILPTAGSELPVLIKNFILKIYFTVYSWHPETFKLLDWANGYSFFSIDSQVMALINSFSNSQLMYYGCWNQFLLLDKSPRVDSPSCAYFSLHRVYLHFIFSFNFALHQSKNGQRLFWPQEFQWQILLVVPVVMNRQLPSITLYK